MMVTTVATDIGNNDDEGNDASSMTCDKGDNHNRDDGKDTCASTATTCASSMATTQPVVTRKCIERWRRCKEMRRDNQLA